MAEPSDAITVKRSMGRQVANLVLTPIGAVAFLVMAAALGSGEISPDPMARLLGGLIFGFFGLLLAAGAVAAIMHGLDSRLIEVDAGDVWLPEMGRLPWSALAEVRLETIRGVGGGDGPVTAAYRRLGFVPRDPSIRPNAATSFGWSMTRGFFALLRRMAPDARFGADDAAPFGVMEVDAGKAFEPLLEAVRRHVEIVDADERRAREHAPRWAAPISAGATPALTEAIVRKIDATIGRDAVVPTPRGASALLVGADQSLVVQPRAAFSAPVAKPAELVGVVIALVAPIAFFVGIGGPFPDQSAGIFAMVFIAAVLAAFLVPGFLALRRWVQRSRLGRSPSVLLDVGPDGIWLPEMGRRAWDQIRQVRTERAGWTRSGASPEVGRWRLVVVPVDGPYGTAGGFGVDSDALDARFDDVLDLVRFYHPVVETG